MVSKKTERAMVTIGSRPITRGTLGLTIKWQRGTNSSFILAVMESPAFLPMPSRGGKRTRGLDDCLGGSIVHIPLTSTGLGQVYQATRNSRAIRGGPEKSI